MTGHDKGPGHDSMPRGEETVSVEAPPGAVLVVVGMDDDDVAGREAAVRTAIGIAGKEHRRLVFIDRGGEGPLGNVFYDDMRADDELKPRKDDTFDARIAAREGRTELASYIETATEAGIDAGGWFPTHPGLDGVKAAIDLFDGAILVVPATVQEPGIRDRVFGMTPGALEELDIDVVIVGS